MAAKPAKAPRGSKLFVTFEVLQNGATMLSSKAPVRRRGALTLTSVPNGELSLPYYPLPNHHLDFIRFDRGTPVLIAAHKWEGFCTSKGELISVARADKGRREIPMRSGDYASICYDDLRILVKVGPARKAVQGTKSKLKGYRGSFMGAFLPTIEEKRTTLLGALVATVILGGATVGLLKRKVSRPGHLSEIDSTYVLPFVSPDHLRHGPEALQNNLDRKHAVNSVIGYYESVTSVLMGWDKVEPRYIAPTSLETYQRLHREADELKNAKIARQAEIDNLQDMKSDVSIAAIPTVVGESMTGSMLRLIDKTKIMHEGFAEDVKAKREILAVFPKDPEYSFDEYRTVAASKNEVAAAYLAKIRPWGRSTDEEAMYEEAESLAKRAARGHDRILGTHQILVSNTSRPPIGMPDGARHASFAYDVDFMLADEKLAKIEASEFGAPVRAARPAVSEPLVGQIERDLIERFIQQHKFQLQLCYELALKRNELASGTMEWRWRIDSRGTISDIALVSTNIRDNRMAQCIRDKISQWRFPRPRRGAVEVSYPFEFAPSRG